jgi:hypothetical protein
VHDVLVAAFESVRAGEFNPLAGLAWELVAIIGNVHPFGAPDASFIPAPFEQIRPVDPDPAGTTNEKTNA